MDDEINRNDLRIPLVLFPLGSIKFGMHEPHFKIMNVIQRPTIQITHCITNDLIRHRWREIYYFRYVITLPLLIIKVTFINNCVTIHHYCGILLTKTPYLSSINSFRRHHKLPIPVLNYLLFRAILVMDHRYFLCF